MRSCKSLTHSFKVTYSKYLRKIIVEIKKRCSVDENKSVKIKKRCSVEENKRKPNGDKTRKN